MSTAANATQTAPSTGLSPKLQQVARRVADNVRHAAANAAANPSTSLEMIIAQRLKALPADRRQALVSRWSTAARSLSPAPAPLTPEDIAGIKRSFLGLPGLHLGTATAHLQFRILQVDCIEDTNEPLAKDSIEIGGSVVETALDPSGAQIKGEATEVKNFALGKFKTGDSQTYHPPKVFSSINLSDGTVFPKTFAFLVTIAEKDLGGFAKFLDEIVKEINKDITKELDDLGTKAGTAVGAAAGAALGATIGALLGNIVGAVIGMIAGFVLGLLVDFLKDVFQDDIFTPVAVTLPMPSADFRFPNGQTTSPEGQMTFADFGGRYNVHFDMAIV